MSEKPITPLRQRMIEDMSVRRFTPATQRQYIRAVKRLAAFLGRSPDTATPEELRSFQLHLTGTGVQPTSINTTVTALRWRPAYQNKAVVYDWPGLAQALSERGYDGAATVEQDIDPAISLNPQADATASLKYLQFVGFQGTCFPLRGSSQA